MLVFLVKIFFPFFCQDLVFLFFSWSKACFLFFLILLFSWSSACFLSFFLRSFFYKFPTLYLKAAARKAKVARNWGFSSFRDNLNFIKIKLNARPMRLISLPMVFFSRDMALDFLWTHCSDERGQCIPIEVDFLLEKC